MATLNQLLMAEATEYEFNSAVEMSIETYEREMTLADVYKKMAVAEKQVQDGELLNGQEVLAKLRKKHGR